MRCARAQQHVGKAACRRARVKTALPRHLESGERGQSAGQLVPAARDVLRPGIRIVRDRHRRVPGHLSGGLGRHLSADRDPARRDQLSGLVPGPGKASPDELRVQPSPHRHGHCSARQMRLTAASGIRAPRPRTGTCRAKYTLFAAPAGLTRMRLAALAARGRPPRVTELAEYLAQPVVDIFEYGGPLGEVNAINRGEPVDGRVNTEVTGGGESWPNPFCIHRVFLSSGTLVTRIGSQVRYPPA